MPCGYEVLNDSGGILLDANYPNLALVAKGTIDIGQNPNVDGTYGFVRVPNTGMPMVFIRCENFAAVLGMEPGGFTYFLGKGSTRFDYWAFAPPQDLDARFGMQVFTVDAKLAFDASQKYLKIMGSINTFTSLTVSKQGGVGGIASFPLPEGMPAVCFSDPGFQYEGFEGDEVWGGITYRTTSQCSMRISGSTLELALVYSNASQGLPGDIHAKSRGAASPRSVILADVSGI